ncbi:MAG: HAMP domain-containing protein [Bacteroidetes bacterium]|nr:MAG: HAMP domain-containing protein [Bacteroidota bacterium]TAG85678.1 MAG: HAMP domain-containing protein [Bacteroidota bacterium]
MNFLSNLRLQQKIFLFTSILICFIFILLFIGISWNMRAHLFKQQDEKMQEHLTDLINLCELHKEDRQYSLDNAANLAKNIFGQLGQAREDSVQSVVINATHQETQSTIKLTIPVLYAGKQKITFNYDWVDNIQKLTSFQCIIFQKIPQGFIRTASTHVISDKNLRVVGTYIPNEGKIAKKLLEGKDYIGSANNNNSPVLTHYMPIKNNKGKIIGALAVGGQIKNNLVLGEKMTKRKYFNNAYVYAMLGNGEVIYHPNPAFKGTNFKHSNPNFYATLLKNKEGKDRYSINNEWRWQYYKYYEPFDMYIGIVVSEKNFINLILNDLIGMLVFMLLALLLLSLYLMNVLLRPLLKPLKEIEIVISRLSEGISVKELDINRKDEIGEICNSLNVLIQQLKKYTYFAEEIGKNNLETKLELNNEYNVLGNSLIKMQYNLKNLATENKLRSWAIEHNIIISEILRKYSESIELLSEKVLDFFIEHLNIQQGAFYVVEEYENKTKFLNLKIAYAYERKKMIKKQIDITDGLLGQAYHTGSMIYSEDMPKDYLSYVTGLEDYTATYLLIVPLKIGDDVFGVLELVSFYPIEKYKLDFATQSSETIASSMSITQSNELTKQLLVDMQETTERLLQQDEELRQNLEELQALQDISDTKQAEIEKLLANAEYQKQMTKENSTQLKMMQIEGLKKQQEYLQIIDEYKKEIETLKKRG